jgi:hypothetical protein
MDADGKLWPPSIVNATGALIDCDSGIVGANRTDPDFKDCNRNEAAVEDIVFLEAQPTRTANTNSNPISAVGFEFLRIRHRFLEGTIVHLGWTPPAVESSTRAENRFVLSAFPGLCLVSPLAEQMASN